MKFTINSDELSAVVKRFTTIIPAKTTLPILETIKFDVGDGELKLTGTDQRVWLTQSIKIYEQNSEGGVLIHADRLKQLLSTFKNAFLTFNVEDNNDILIRSGTGKYWLKGLPIDDYFVDVDLDKEFEFLAEIPDVGKAINKVRFAASTDAYRPAMLGIHMHFNNDILTTVATDSFRLVKYMSSLDACSSDLALLLPLECANILMDIHSTATVSILKIIDRPEHIKFEAEGLTVVSNLINEKFPPYNAVIPDGKPATTLKFNKTEMLGALQRNRLFAALQASKLIHIEAGVESLILSADNGIDACSEQVGSVHNAIDLSLHFNIDNLTGIIRNIDADEVAMELFGTKPVKVSAACPDELTSIIMPVLK